jgi:hypothetical protein
MNGEAVDRAKAVARMLKLDRDERGGGKLDSIAGHTPASGTGRGIFDSVMSVRRTPFPPSAGRRVSRRSRPRAFSTSSMLLYCRSGS